MRLVTVSDMRALEAAAELAGVSSITLMENAGTAAAILLMASLTPKSEVTIICGKGNNGGDGLVMARILARAEVNVSVILTAANDQLSEASRHNAERLTSSHIRVQHLLREADVPAFFSGDFVVDCLLGTGATGEPSPLYARLITAINQSPGKVIAIDLPTGVDADSGVCASNCVQAHETFTLGFPKFGLFISPGREAAGAVSVIPIGLPTQTSIEYTAELIALTANDAVELLPVRSPVGHKGTFGKVLIVGGSAGLSGAPRLSALGALHSGCGLAKVACPESIRSEVAAMLMEITTHGMPDVARKGVIALRALGEVRALIAEHDALVIGPGLGRHHETMELVRRVVSSLQQPAVIDADALFALGDIRERVFEQPHVLTPHAGEFERLFQIKPPDDINQRVTLVREIAKKHAITLVLKGSPTLVSSSTGEVTLIPTGNDGMATGGTGDILAGVIGTLLAQHLAPFDAARLGAYVHGLAGDIVAVHTGRRGMIASDLAVSLGETLLKLDTFVPSEVKVIRPE